MAGIPPATDAPYSSRLRASRARSCNSGPLSAIRSLFAVTTDFPLRSAFRIQSPAGFTPPASSTKISASEESTSLMLSVQRTLDGTQSTFFRPILRLKMCVNSNVSLASWQSSLATERPTVPKPAIAIFSFRLRETGFFARPGFPGDLEFERFDFAGNASPHQEPTGVWPSHQDAWVRALLEARGREGL